MRKIFNRCFPGLGVALLLAGCSTEMTVEEIGWRRNTSTGYFNHIHGDDILSKDAVNFLTSSRLADTFDDTPADIIRLLDQIFRDTRERRYLEILTDLCYYQADRSGKADEAIKFYMSAAYYSYLYLFGQNLYPAGVSEYQPQTFRMTRFYNASVMAIYEYLRAKQIFGTDSFQLPTVASGGVVFLPIDGHLSVSPQELSDGLLCADFQAKNVLTFSYQFGLGVPLIFTPREEFALTEERVLFNQTFPATLFLRFSNDQDHLSVQPELWDPLTRESLSVADRKVPLEYDLTTPLAYFMRRPTFADNIWYMLNPDASQAVEGLYLLTPYDPDKIPVLLVHGLMSNPRTWAQLINTLMGDIRIRDNYQFWMFTYSTGNPIIYSAQQMRKALRECYEELDPENHNRALQQMVLIGHSMGGLLAKTMIKDSEPEALEPLLGRPLAEITSELAPEQYAFLLEMFGFKHLPFIRRVIFMAVPHRGSDMATWSIVKWTTRLITLPHEFVQTALALSEKLLAKYDLIEMEQDPVYLRTGIDGLDPSNDSLQLIDELPFTAGIPYHSIIGNYRAAGIPGGSDGIVPYSSAHLDHAASELIVKSGHSVQATSPAIEEVRRILLLHLRENGRLPAIPESFASDLLLKSTADDHEK
ncbi:triacylglycerol lipase [Victivallis sp. Marseille-Q1083]|uniref:esterase/lipase family protein n=1 Tax=Victivallis sp. Marseille-Q1083 TaxID=2717288 RepID=UPI00158C44D8|nr:alpha/beta hydrolase [Victivallis sp. Marseille-Q1083]